MTVYELLQRATETALPPSSSSSNSSSSSSGQAQGQGHRGIWWTLFNGAMAGLAAQTVTYPGDTVRRRMQTNGAGGSARVYKNSIDCTVKMLKNEGLKGFFKGAWTNTVRCLPGAAIQFAAYEACKKVLGC